MLITMSRRIYCLFCLFCLSVFAMPSWAQQPGSAVAAGTVSGSVEDPSGGVLAGVVVALRPASAGATPVQAITDASGRFHFRAVRAGKYQVQVESSGFAPASVPVAVPPLNPPPVRIVLALAESSQQVTVNGSAPEVSLDPAENRDAVSLSGDALQNLPVFDQDYIATASRFLNSGDLGSGG